MHPDTDATEGASKVIDSGPRSVPTPPAGSLSARLRSLARKKTPDLLREVNFRHYWLAATVSYLGDQVTTIALPLTAVLALGASPAQVGFLAAAVSLPNLLLSLHAGAFVDRWGRRRKTMILADLLRAALLATIPVTYALHVLAFGQLYAVAFLAGSLTVVFGVSTASLFTAIVPKDRYFEGNSLSQGTYAFSWIAGPSIGGVLVALLSAPYALVADSLSFLGSALFLGSISPKEPPGDKAAAHGVLEGLRFVRKTPALLAKLVSYTSLNVFYFMYFTLMLLYVVRYLHLPAGLIGLALGIGAVGALLGSMVSARVTRRIGVGPAMIVGTIGYPAALVLVPLAPDARVVALLFLIAAEFMSGFALAIVDMAGTSLQQVLVPDRVRARIQGVLMMSAYGARPAGSLAAGLIATLIGVRPTLFLAVAGGIASVLFLLPSPIPRMRDLPAAAE